ncbi:ankyrin repeat domain-containing protein [Magnetococcales bacterium HHB-1]
MTLSRHFSLHRVSFFSWLRRIQNLPKEAIHDAKAHRKLWSLAGVVLLIPGFLLSSFIQAPTTSERPFYTPQQHTPRWFDPAAAFNYDPAAFKLMLDKGDIDPEQTDLLGRTALIWAAEQGEHMLVQHLLQSGVDVNRKDNWGRTALTVALSRNHREIANMLIEYDADLSA